MVKNCVFAFLLLVLAAASAFHVATMSSSPIISRRECLSLVVGGSAFLSAAPGFSVEGGDPYGKEGRKEMESVSTQTPSPSSANAPFPDVPFTELPSGVKYKEFRAGAGAEVAPGSRVSIQITGRLLNLNGVKFYSTKDNIVDELAGPEPLIFTAGKGQLIPGLEEGILGMKKGGVRRIVVPAKLGYAAGPTLQPQPTKQLDKNALDSVLKNPRRDASLLFDVQVERLK